MISKSKCNTGRDSSSFDDPNFWARNGRLSSTQRHWCSSNWDWGLRHHGSWAIRLTYHTVLKASPGAAIFGQEQDMLFDILSIADWNKIGDYRQHQTDLNNLCEMYCLWLQSWRQNTSTIVQKIGILRKQSLEGKTMHGLLSQFIWMKQSGLQGNKSEKLNMTSKTFLWK